MSTEWTIAFVALFVLTLGLAVIVLGMLRRMLTVLEHAGAESSVRGTLLPEPPDSPSFDIVGSSVADLPGHRWADLGDRTVLFLEDSCEGCRALAIELTAKRKRLVAAQQPLLFVVDSLNEAFKHLPTEFPVVYDEDRSIGRAWGVQSSPIAYFVSAQGFVVAANHPHTLQGVLELRERVSAAHSSVD